MTTPATGLETTGGTETHGGARQLRELFDLQAAHRWTMAKTTAAERIERLGRLRDAIRERREEICAAMAADFGKPAIESELTEIQLVLDELGVAIRELPRWMRPLRVRTPLTLFGSRSEVRYEPLGLILVLAPWNYPFLLAIDPIIAAVAAGNCVIARPSHKTPHSARCVQSLVGSVFPEHEVTVVLGDQSVAVELLGLPFDHVFFTGSTAVGRKVMAAASEHLSSVTLELGGQSPVIVDESADIETAAERIAWGKFINAGQTCVAPDYALVHEAVADRFAAALVAVISRFYGGDEATRAASADLACMVSPTACRRLERALAGAVAEGARLVVGGRIDAEARRVTPTIITNVRPDSPILAEEIFGPILPIVTVANLDEAVAILRRRAKPLALYIFSTRRANIDFVLDSTTAGGTSVNHVVMHLANPHLPFGGVGDSGMGNYHGRFGFETMSHARAVYTQTLPSAVRWLFPPYTERSKQMLGLMRRIPG
jgi:aldehyde dehydrogenase (NAD+)